MISRNSPTAELEAAVERVWVPNPYPDDERFAALFIERLRAFCQSEWGFDLPCIVFVEAIGQIALDFWHLERRQFLHFPREAPTDPIHTGRYRDRLLELLKLSQESPSEWTAKYIDRLIQVFKAFLAILPEDIWFAKEDSKIRIRVIDLDPQPVIGMLSNLVYELIGPTDFDNIAFKQVGDIVFQNCPDTQVNGKLQVIWPEQNIGTPQQLIDLYLKRTPFQALFTLPLPLREEELVPEEELEEPAEPGEPAIEERYWYQHCLLLAGTGGGKTNAIRWRIVDILFQVERGEASLILMEPKGVLTRELIQLIRASGLGARLTVIEPGDPHIAVNLFERDDNSAQGINSSINRISRIFNTITLELTPFQRTALTFALRAMFAMPGPVNLRTLMHILRNGIEDVPADNLSFAVRDFFQNEFKPGTAGARAGGEIISRLNGLLADPVFESLFAADRTTFNVGDEMQHGKVIIINASAASALYSRFWIEEIARTVRPRLALPFSHRMPTTFIIDEAQNFIAEDLHFAEILDMAREARIGMLIAAHHMGQITNDHVRNSLYTNTALKFVARTSADIFNLCRSMGQTEPAFLNTLPQYHFGFFGPNMHRAIEVTLPLVEFTKTRIPPSAGFQSAADGHVYVDARINGASVRMLVDTGATNICLTLADASAAHISIDTLAFTGSTNTANGATRFAPVTLRELRIDNVVLSDMPAVVLENLWMSLLGQDFLRELQSYEMRNGTLTMQPKPIVKPPMEDDTEEQGGISPGHSLRPPSPDIPRQPRGSDTPPSEGSTDWHG